MLLVALSRRPAIPETEIKGPFSLRARGVFWRRKRRIMRRPLVMVEAAPRAAGIRKPSSFKDFGAESV